MDCGRCVAGGVSSKSSSDSSPTTTASSSINLLRFFEGFPFVDLGLLCFFIFFDDEYEEDEGDEEVEDEDGNSDGVEDRADDEDLLAPAKPTSSGSPRILWR